MGREGRKADIGKERKEGGHREGKEGSKAGIGKERKEGKQGREGLTLRTWKRKGKSLSTMDLGITSPRDFRKDLQSRYNA